MPLVTWDDVLRPGNATDFFTREPRPVFEADDRSYSAANAWWLAELSRLVYRHDVEEDAAAPEPRRSGFLAKAGLQQTAFFKSLSGDTQALLVRADAPSPFAVLVFRGTEQKLQDFVHDADTVPILAFGGSCRVHRGFERALNAVWRQMSSALQQLDCPVFYTGHSLGAALATLAAARRAPRALYTFGSPRVGDVQLADKLAHVPVYRVVHADDIVTLVPPESFGFEHVGEMHRIGAARSSATSFAANFSLDALWRPLRSPPKPLADHAPINYVSFV